MGNVQDPQAGTGGAYTGGTNPYPGGTIDTGDSLVPPYEGRAKSPDDTESTRAKTESIERQLRETASKGEAEVGQVSAEGGRNVDPSTGKPGSPIGSDEVSHRTPNDPHGVGTSASAKGESYAEPADQHKGATNRPVGQVEGDLMEPNNSASGTSDVD